MHALFTTLTALALATSVDDEPYRAAIVIGQNTPDDEALGELRYADDDAVLTHALFREARVDSILLARLDDDTRALHPTVDASAPTIDAVNAALSTLFARLQAARARGQRAEFIFFFSGHGDLTDGEGSILLDDGRLLRSSLYDDILMVSPADRNHVIIDACRSYFLAFAKGAGGGRARAPEGFTERLTQSESAVRARTGFFLSTSSDEESHEWDRLQAGIFSHELRSAVRGAADADVDGHVSYREIQAFLDRANGGIANSRFRPSFTVVPPLDDAGGDQMLLSWPEDAEVLTLDDARLAGHVTLENGDGIRLADIPPSRGHTRRIVLPTHRPLFVVDMGSRQEREIRERGSTRVSVLDDQTPRVAAKGARHLAFDALFKLPYGGVDVRATRFGVPSGAGAVESESLLAMPLLAGSITLGAAGALFGVVALGATIAAATIAITGLSTSQVERVERNEIILALDVVSLVGGVLAVASFAGSGASLFGLHQLEKPADPFENEPRARVSHSRGGGER
jgi:hypothetical protein